MVVVTISEAEKQLAQLLDRVEAGEDVRIEREGRVVARLAAMPFDRHWPPRTPQFGGDEGRYEIPEDLDAPDPEFEKLFYGE